jgi:hypothetical protein
MKAPTKAPRAPMKAPTKAPRAPTKAPTKAPRAPTKAPTKAPHAPTNAPRAPVAASDVYTIQLDLTGIPSTEDHAIFEQAQAKWESVITGDLPSYDIRSLGTSTGCELPEEVDDMFICARYEDIDGLSNVLGYASSEYIRGPWEAGVGLPINGVMVFDSADVPRIRAGPTFMNTILHEMGHILGTLGHVGLTT